VLLAILGSAALVILLATVTSMLTVLNRTAADLLPAKQTIALVQNPGEPELALMQSLFPNVTMEYGNTLPEAVAILELPSTQQASVLLYQQKDAPKNDTGFTATLGTYVIVASQEGALPLIRQGDGRLAYDNAYMALHGRKERKQPWLFVRKNALASAEDASGQFMRSLMLQQGNALALELQGSGGQTLEVLGEKTSLLQPSVLPLAPTDSTVFTAGIFDLRDLWTQALKGMKPEKRTVFTGTIHSLVQKAFGSSVSTEYDILPLLKKDSVITLNRTSSGQLIGMIHGHVDNTEQLGKALDRMHQGFRTKLPSIQTQTYRFDDRFSTTNIRSDRSAVEQDMFMQNNWQIRSTHKTNAVNGLFTAVRQNEYVISNNRDMLLQTMEAKSPLMSIGESDHLLQSTRQASGWLRKAALQQLLEEHLSVLLTDSTAVLTPALRENITWSLERQGKLSVIHLYSE